MNLYAPVMKLVAHVGLKTPWASSRVGSTPTRCTKIVSSLGDSGTTLALMSEHGTRNIVAIWELVIFKRKIDREVMYQFAKLRSA